MNCDQLLVQRETINELLYKQSRSQAGHVETRIDEPKSRNIRCYHILESRVN